jgi:hypothetical protein
MKINQGTAAGLIGIFSSDRKAAKARELQIAQTQYKLSQQKLQQQFAFSQQQAQNKAAANKLAASIKFRKQDASNLSDSLDNVFDEMKAGVAKYGGNVMKYMAAEGNDKWATAVGDYEGKIAALQNNEKEIAKYYELVNSGKASLVMDKDTRRLQDYIDGKTNTFVFSGQLEDIKYDFRKNVSSGKKVTAEDVLSGGDEQNRRIIIKNYMREYGLTDPSQITEENLLKYTELSYLAGMPDLMGTKEDDRTIGGQLFESATNIQKLNLEKTNPFDLNSIDEALSYVEPELGRHGYNKNSKPKRRFGSKTRVIGSGNAYENYQEEMNKAVFNIESGNYVRDLEATGLYSGKDGQQIEDTQWYGEVLGGESSTYDVNVTGYHYAFEYKIDGKSQLAISTGDEEKDAELRANFEASGAKPNLVLVAELREKDPLRDDYYYKKVDLTRSQISEISSKADYKIEDKQFNNINNQNAVADKKRKAKGQFVSNIATNHFDGNDTIVEQIQFEALNTSAPTFSKHGLDRNKMFTPLLSFMMAQSSSTSDLFDRLDKLDNVLHDKNNPFSVALLSNNIKTFNDFAQKQLSSQQEYNEFISLQSDWHGVNTNSQF